MMCRKVLLVCRGSFPGPFCHSYLEKSAMDVNIHVYTDRYIHIQRYM